MSNTFDSSPVERFRALRSQRNEQEREQLLKQERLRRSRDAIDKLKELTLAMRVSPDSSSPKERKNHCLKVTGQVAETLAALCQAGLLDDIDRVDEFGTIQHCRQQREDPQEARILYAYAKHLIEVDPDDHQQLARLVRDSVEEPGLSKVWDWVYVLLDGLAGRQTLRWKQGPSEIPACVAPASGEGKPATPSDTPPGTTTAPDEPEPTELACDILQAMRELGAFDKEHRQTAEEISERVGGEATAQSAKKPLSDLKGMQLVESKIGRKGGSWLTAKGREFIDRCRPSGKR